VPTPWSIGTVNAFLVEDDPLTLVDCGPRHEGSFAALEMGVAALGHRLADVELLVLTHQHVDHVGLAYQLVERFGMRIAALDELEPYMRSFEESTERDDAAAADLMRVHGVPEDLVIETVEGSLRLRHIGDSARTDIVLRAGGALELARRTLRVVHAPGHSPTDTLFVDEQRGVAFGGDHLIADVASNALVGERLVGEPYAEHGRRDALAEYRASLARTQELDLAVVLAGHGGVVRDHRAVLAVRFERIERRLETIAGHLAAGPSSAHELTLRMWGPKAVEQPYLTLSEVIGHLDLLAARGRVAESRPPVIWSLS
jgi:glyoxylase-like metal-dependent hydrolase (beta-lactamase superfamily II)